MTAPAPTLHRPPGGQASSPDRAERAPWQHIRHDPGAAQHDDGHVWCQNDRILACSRHLVSLPIFTESGGAVGEKRAEASRGNCADCGHRAVLQGATCAQIQGTRHSALEAHACTKACGGQCRSVRVQHLRMLAIPAPGTRSHHVCHCCSSQRPAAADHRQPHCPAQLSRRHAVLTALAPATLLLSGQPSWGAAGAPAKQKGLSGTGRWQCSTHVNEHRLRHVAVQWSRSWSSRARTWQALPTAL